MRAGPAAAAALAVAVAAASWGCGGGGGTTTATAPTSSSAYTPGATELPAPARPARTTASPRPRPRPGPAPPTTAARPAPAAPPIVQRPIPFGARRRAETAAYALRHYGLDTWRLVSPRVIVEHYTDGDTFASAYATFAADVPDVELHELPGLCAHYVVDRDGTIYQLVPAGVICRHTVGLNWTAIGIEQVGRSAQEILARSAQVASVVRLTAWLRCRYGIPLRDVIGHAESLGSPYHHERVARLRSQTHGDWTTAEMAPIRARLRAFGGC